MRYHLLYVCAPKARAQISGALERMQARTQKSKKTSDGFFELKHELLGSMVLEITIVDHLDAIAPHLRLHPVDLLIYDERGDPNWQRASSALEVIKKDVRALGELWGPDFLFPMSRVVAILESEDRSAERAFELGRLQVRDVCVAPKSTATVLLWLKRVLTQGVFRRKKVGMALAGGGLEGLLYQVGVLYALEEAVSGFREERCHVVSGVSSGAIAGTMFAAGVPSSEVIRAFQQRSSKLPALTSSMIFDVAAFDITKRIIKESVGWVSLSPQQWINKALRSFPTGIIKGDRIEEFFRDGLEAFGLRDRFEELPRELYIGATDQDSYEHVIFGLSPWDKVHVSEAVRASCALPPLFLPKQINGRWFIDGQVTKTTDLELVVERGCSLVVIVNPLKPHVTTVPGSTDAEGGLYGVIQTIKALVSSRFEASLKHLTERYPDIDFLVFEPDEECAAAMAGSPMRYRIRTEVIQLAYASTLRKLRERHAVYQSKLERYGYKLKEVAQIRELERKSVEEV